MHAYSDLEYIMESMMNDPEAAQAATEMMAMQAEIYEVLGVVLLAAVGIGLVLGLLMIIATWKILKKSGNKGWKALIPVYSDYMLIKISWKKKYFWWMLALAFLSGAVGGAAPYFADCAMLLFIVELALFVPVMVIGIKAEVKLAKAFGKGGGFAVGMILLPWLFYPILGFGKAKFRRRKKRRRKALPASEA